MSLKNKVNIATLLLVLLILFFSRHELVTAWHMLSTINISIFLLIIPIQFLSYYAGGAMMFSYLRAKGDLEGTSSLEATKMALELNFVNHLLPSGGVSGASYMTWRLSKLGITSGRATLAQAVRFGATFASFAIILVISVLFITIDGNINRLTILVSSALVTVIIVAALVFGFAFGSDKRLEQFSRIVYRTVNWVWRKVLRQKNEAIGYEKVSTFFNDLHTDYVALRKQPEQLKKPFVWGFVFNFAETAMFFVTFLAMGVFVNPAPIFIAVGLAALVGLFLFTPGGAGGYEAAMILFLSTAGVNPGVAVAGVLLARVTLIILTIASGYFFYHVALRKYGRQPT